jgi:hypothetical protein
MTREREREGGEGRKGGVDTCPVKNWKTIHPSAHKSEAGTAPRFSKSSGDTYSAVPTKLFGCVEFNVGLV